MIVAVPFSSLVPGMLISYGHSPILGGMNHGGLRKYTVFRARIRPLSDNARTAEFRFRLLLGIVAYNNLDDRVRDVLISEQSSVVLSSTYMCTTSRHGRPIIAMVPKDMWNLEEVCILQ